MLKPFFSVAMRAPARQLGFRRAALVHAGVMTALAWAAASTGPTGLVVVAHLVLVLGIVEGGAIVGWRLTQIPKSQALEFLLVSPVQPRRVFLAEACVGAARFALVVLAGLPQLLTLWLAGTIELADLWALLFMPYVWGLIAGLGLTAWAYEPVWARKVGELIGLLGVTVYLVVGILAGENLKLWLQRLPKEWADRIHEVVVWLFNGNPFGVVRNWFEPGRAPDVVWAQFCELHALAGVALLGLLWRASSRLKGHFHDRHYRPVSSGRASEADAIGDRPLAWWAVRRVMEYSGRVNIWLAGGFSLAYCSYLVAGDRWPPWMGRLVFQIFEAWGGAPMLATAMCVMAAVPAAFQYGLWDPTVGDRCRRLELLLLSNLEGADYWHASLAAAWRRGRGYLAVAGALWVALAWSGRVAWYEAAAAALGGAALWAFSFAVGFRAFCTGRQASGVASGLVLGLPILLILTLRLGGEVVSGVIPPALCFLPVSSGLSVSWVAGLVLTTGVSLALTYRGLDRCDAELRAWYDANQGASAGGVR